MHRRISKKIIIYFFLLIIVSSINNNSINNIKFNKTQNIHVSGLSEKDNQILLNEIKNLNLKTIFYINKNELVNLLNEHSLIERYEVFKKYPSTINIKIDKTNFFAKTNINGKTFLVGSNGKLLLNEANYSKLPYIFGKPDVQEFLKLKKAIDESKFSYQQIKNFYFFPSNRWDIKFKDEFILKLPNKFTNETLDQIYKFIESYKIKNFKIIDARVENQIILNE
tara:strand:+ start:140 stop:811 length:672 start_codon:yes stop_codon:yes gene_type:complete